MTIPRQFYQLAVLWGILGLAVSWVASSAGVLETALWFGAFWLLSIADFAAIAGVVRTVLSSPIDPIFAMAWGLAKLACLGLFGLLLFNAKTAPMASVILGVGTLVIVPLLSAAWWRVSGNLSKELGEEYGHAR